MCAWRRNSRIQFPTHQHWLFCHYELAFDVAGALWPQVGNGEGSSQDPGSPSLSQSRPHWTVLQRLCLGSEHAATVPESRVGWPFSPQNKPPFAINCRQQQTVCKRKPRSPTAWAGVLAVPLRSCVALRCHFTSLCLSFPISFLGLL